MPPPTQPVSPPTPAEPAVSGADMLRGRLMRRALQLMLDRVPGSRDVMPHLAALELALGVQGSGAIDAMPKRHLPRVISQLRVLPAPPDDAVLRDLTARLMRAAGMEVETEAPAQLGFDPEATVVISEGSHSDFLAALDLAAQQPAPAGA